MRLVREAPLRSTEVVVVLRPGIGPRTTTTPVEPSRGSRTPAIPTTTPVEPVSAAVQTIEGEYESSAADGRLSARFRDDLGQYRRLDLGGQLRLLALQAAGPRCVHALLLL